jgi:hypothetical protein
VRALCALRRHSLCHLSRHARVRRRARRRLNGKHD